MIVKVFFALFILVCLATPDATACGTYGERPPVPEFALDMNGMEWPRACYPDKDVYHAFVIGDWGGMCGYGMKNDCTLSPEESQSSWDHHDHDFRPYPMPNRRGLQSNSPLVDKAAQLLVRDRMHDLAEDVDPEFVFNVGDSFYPGSIIEHCAGSRDSVDFHRMPHQFQTTYEDMYNHPKLKNKEWMSVLGNHDYGGVCFNAGWPQQIWYTWNQASSKRWIMPGQYYSRKFTFGSGSAAFTMDAFFIDTNIEDTAKDEDHDICSKSGNTYLENAGNKNHGWYCEGFLGNYSQNPNHWGICEGLQEFSSPSDCNAGFRKLWADQLKWLEEGLAASDADWQVIVTHFPAYYPKLHDDLNPLAAKYGVDMIFAGHVHSQEIWYHRDTYGQDWGGTALLTSGGGGGIFSEGTPKADGHDNQYGFMDLAITKESVTVSSYSWGVTGQTIHVDVSVTADALTAQDGATCCWGNYWGCEGYPQGGGGGVCSSDYKTPCTSDPECSGDGPPPDGPTVPPTPSSYSHCSGSYTELAWEHNGNKRYEGGASGECTIYWHTSRGWVLNNQKNTDGWFCQGGNEYKLPGGDWYVNKKASAVQSCKATVSKGDMIKMMERTITQRQAEILV